MNKNDSTKKIKILGLILFFTITINLELKANESVDFFSNAYDIKSGKLQYKEIHKQNWVNGTHISSKVVYLNAKGEVIAEKTLNFSKSKTQPDFEYKDTRDGYVEGSILNNNKIDLKFQENNESKLENKIIPISDNLVVDAGFDYFVKQNWDKLNSGLALQTEFAVPERLDFYKFKIYKTGTTKKNEIEFLQLKFVPVNRLLRLLTSDINLEYEIEKRRLSTYEGITNVNDNSGKKYRAKIVFGYSDQKSGISKNNQ